MPEKKLMTGNEALVRAAIKAGCKFFAGYPITPQNEIPEKMSSLLPEAGGVFIQAEAELTAINMVYGAAATGARAMTSSSGPGISLKQEAISFISSVEIPCVIVNMMRGGPGLGNIRASQADYFQAVKGGGQSDYNLIVFAPSNHEEVYDLTFKAFDYADLYRIPVMIIADGIVAQMVEPVELKEYVPIAALPSKKDWALTGAAGRKHHKLNTLLIESPDALTKHNTHLQEKYRKIETELQMCNEFMTEDAEILIAAYGTPARVAKETISMAREKGIKVGLLQPLILWPFPTKYFNKYLDKKILVVEMSEGQFIDDVKLYTECKADYYFLGHGGGWYPDTDQILKKLEEIK